MQTPRRMEWPSQSPTSFASSSGGLCGLGSHETPVRRKAMGNVLVFGLKGLRSSKASTPTQATGH